MTFCPGRNRTRWAAEAIVPPTTGCSGLPSPDRAGTGLPGSPVQGRALMLDDLACAEKADASPEQEGGRAPVNGDRRPAAGKRLAVEGGLPPVCDRCPIRGRDDRLVPPGPP